MDCSPSGFSVHEIFQERILEWVAISSSRGSSWSRNWTCFSCISCIGRQILYQSHLTSSSALPSACLDPSFLLSPQPVPITWHPSHPSKHISNAYSFIKSFLIPSSLPQWIWTVFFETFHMRQRIWLLLPVIPIFVPYIRSLKSEMCLLCLNPHAWPFVMGVLQVCVYDAIQAQLSAMAQQ